LPIAGRIGGSSADKGHTTMRLILQNGYPYPFPEGLTPAQEENINEGAPGRTLTLEDVVHFEWKHTVTVEFASWAHAAQAQEVTGWPFWCPEERKPILEAETSAGDGYEHPAIVVKDVAYCSFILKD
jgi:hypothetical protein